jgi:hypothetical protein
MVSDKRITLATIQQLKPGEGALSLADGAGILAFCSLIAAGLVYFGGLLPASALGIMLKGVLWLGAGFFGLIGAGNFYDAVTKRPKHPVLDAEILIRCRDLGPVPEPVSAPLDRALNAFAGIQQMSADSAWQRSGLSPADYLQQARTQMLALIERAGRLAKVGAMLDRFEGEAVPKHYRGAEELYREHCRRFSEAAGLMEQAEASLSRALLAAAADAGTGAMVEEPLREMTARFDALAETLEAISETPGILTTEFTMPLRGARDQ